MKKLDIKVEMENGDRFEVTTKTVDYLLWEDTAKKHRWGSFSDSPARWEAFLGWAAIKRMGKYSGTWEEFKSAVDSVEATPVAVEPTNEVVGDASL